MSDTPCVNERLPQPDIEVGSRQRNVDCAIPWSFVDSTACLEFEPTKIDLAQRTVGHCCQDERELPIHPFLLVDEAVVQIEGHGFDRAFERHGNDRIAERSYMDEIAALGEARRLFEHERSEVHASG